MVSKSIVNQCELELPSRFSDGDQATWDKEGYVKKPNDVFYHEKLAELWMKREGLAVKGWLLRPVLKPL